MKEATYGCLSRVNPKFCVNAKLWCKIEQNNFKAGAAQAAARLVYKITALRRDVKGRDERRRQPPFISTLDIPACSRSVRYTVGKEHG